MLARCFEGSGLPPSLSLSLARSLLFRRPAFRLYSFPFLFPILLSIPLPVFLLLPPLYFSPSNFFPSLVPMPRNPTTSGPLYLSFSFSPSSSPRNFSSLLFSSLLLSSSGRRELTSLSPFFFHNASLLFTTWQKRQLVARNSSLEREKDKRPSPVPPSAVVLRKRNHLPVSI